MILLSCPPDFTVHFQVSNGKLIHQRSIEISTPQGMQQMPVEVGCPVGLDSPAKREAMRQELWQAIQHAKDGSAHHVGHLSRDRHKGTRPISQPQLPPNNRPAS